MATRERPSRKLYYSIGEVCEMLDLEPHVLRYWESVFRNLHPSKNRSGNRAYREKDLRIIRLIKYLLHEEGYTIEGADRKLQRLLRVGHTNNQTELFDPPAVDSVLHEVRAGLLEIRSLLGAAPESVEPQSSRDTSGS
ncbi:MerR family transcriptional regulator [Candidatus Fermentibacteria bacterium]|nr:MerR family transcriptional regulator [Candidatus Fermentibacteria bacterium]